MNKDTVYETGFVTKAQENHFKEREPMEYEKILKKHGSFDNPKKPRGTPDSRYPKPKPFYGRGL